MGFSLPGFSSGGAAGAHVKSPVTTTTTTTTAATGQGYVEGGGQVISGVTLSGDQPSLTLTDRGAVERSYELADRAFGSVENVIREAFGEVSRASAATVAAFQSERELSGAVNADRLLRILLIAAGVIGLAFVWVKAK